MKMNKEEKIKVLILLGKSGSGKDTIQKELMDNYIYNHYFHKITITTTRPKRYGEIEGVDYNFVSIEEYEKSLLNGDLITSTFFANNGFYGIRNNLDPNKINLCVFNPSGLEPLFLDDKLDIAIILLDCNDKERLLRQLCRVKNPDVKEIIRRFNQDDKDFEMLEYEYSDLYLKINNDENNPQDTSAKIIDYLKIIGWIKTNN